MYLLKAYCWQNEDQSLLVCCHFDLFRFYPNSRWNVSFFISTQPPPTPQVTSEWTAQTLSFLRSSGSTGPSVSNRLSTSSFPAWPNAHQPDKSDLDTQDLLDSDMKFVGKINGDVYDRNWIRANSLNAQFITVGAAVRTFCAVFKASRREPRKSFCRVPTAAAVVFGEGNVRS